MKGSNRRNWSLPKQGKTDRLTFWTKEGPKMGLNVSLINWERGSVESKSFN